MVGPVRGELEFARQEQAESFDFAAAKLDDRHSRSEYVHLKSAISVEAITGDLLAPPLPQRFTKVSLDGNHVHQDSPCSS